MVIGLSGMTWLMRLSRMSGVTGINAMTDWDDWDGKGRLRRLGWPGHQKKWCVPQGKLWLHPSNYIML